MKKILLLYLSASVLSVSNRRLNFFLFAIDDSEGKEVYHTDTAFLYKETKYFRILQK